MKGHAFIEKHMHNLNGTVQVTLLTSIKSLLLDWNIARRWSRRNPLRLVISSMVSTKNGVWFKLVNNETRKTHHIIQAIHDNWLIISLTIVSWRKKVYRKNISLIVFFPPNHHIVEARCSLCVFMIIPPFSWIDDAQVEELNFMITSQFFVFFRFIFSPFLHSWTTIMKPRLYFCWHIWILIFYSRWCLY